MQVLREAGDSGMALADLVSAMEDKGLKTWDDPRQAKNSGAPSPAAPLLINHQREYHYYYHI